MKIAIMGASGFVGTNFTKHLLLNTNHEALAFYPNMRSFLNNCIVITVPVLPNG